MFEEIMYVPQSAGEPADLTDRKECYSGLKYT
jgi:hypothetical protein